MFKFLKDKKGQGALEYILIIGAAVLIAAIVIAILVSAGRSGKDDANSALSEQQKDFNELKNIANE
ncbi:MAG: class III signal peptide-containing protein [Candidatus ainarchaeum sp.]|nr:class III signal peptide-containing protein [Candidatus ainarchaeum sp.]